MALSVRSWECLPPYNVELEFVSVIASLSGIMGAPPCPPCPHCGEPQLVRYTVKSYEGSYCHCDSCGFIWHHEFRLPRPTIAGFDPDPNAT